jgi:hypothetical protein
MKRKFPTRALAALAAPVILGPQLEEPYAVTGAEAEPLLVVNKIYAGSGGERFISPVDGVILTGASSRRMAPSGSR